MRYIENEGRLVTSASDLKAASECEFAWVRAIDARLGRIAHVVEPEDATLERAARLGDTHERRVLERYLTEDPDGVAIIAQVSSVDAPALGEAVRRTNAALADPSVRIIYQAVFATADFVGFADFLVRDDLGRWLVQDTKLARRARVTALMQLAAYVHHLDELGVPRSDRVELLLGDGTTSSHLVDDILPVYHLRHARLLELIESRHLERGAAEIPGAWGDDAYFACGRCATCQIEVEASRDLLLVAGMRPLQRAKLREAGIRTLDELSVAQVPPDNMNADVFGLLRTQAQLQRASEIAVADAEDDAPGSSGLVSPPAPVYRVVQPAALAALPPADPGDLFFDFEGDPLYTEGAGGDWGIDYLFGWVDDRETFSLLWAHSFTEERAALRGFLDFVDAHRAAHPGMHIYHYAPYEPTHLLAMAARHGTGEAQVDRLLRDGVFVDLYPIVRRALRVGSRSYSIKKLEPLYMHDQTRQSDVQRGDESIVRYVQARVLLDAGDEHDEAAGRAILADIADYNRYDCVSTRRLRNWLRDRAAEHGIVSAADPEPEARGYEPSPRALSLAALAEGADAGDAWALRLAAAAIDYYPREAKSFWATHFLRLREPVSVWEQTRDVAVLDAARCEVVEDWHRAEGHRVDRRVLRLRGELAPGTRLSVGSEPFLLYDLPAPFVFEASPRWLHADHRGRILEEHEDGALVEERARGDFTWEPLPIAMTPPAPPRALSQQAAIDEWADALIRASPAFPRDAATDLLRRRPPRLHAGRPAPADPSDPVPAIIATLHDLDNSYLAVQGPPGTGKTYVGSHVIERLVREHGWKIGVVAQSHAVVEHMLDRVIDAGVPAARVGKAPKDDDPAIRFTPLAKNGIASFVAEHTGAGFVVGGTAWDFSHDGRFPRRSLDLLVIDEAGQFSLASTIAVSVAARRLLLLGDPQQLPQVSQGTHPEPVDTSALGWIMDGASVLPDELGYFLPQSRRMHPHVAQPVSRLSYEGRLASHPSAALRTIDGVDPGLHLLAVEHQGNATASPEEAKVVVHLVRSLIGTAWTDVVRET
ncbi:MAG TPA: DNA helicase, partial [Microbacterium sp.]|nr:DNA helicase [Microbacterium sp.]